MRDALRHPVIGILSPVLFLVLLLCPPTKETAARPPSSVLRPALILQPVVTEKESGCELLLKTFRPIEQYASFQLTSPERLVVDIRHVDFDNKFEKSISCCSWPGAIHVGRHQEKTRIVFHLQEGIESQSRVEQEDEGLRIKINRKSSSMEERKIDGNARRPAVPRHDASRLTPDNIRKLVEEELPDKKMTMSFFKSPAADFFAWTAAESGKGIDVDPDVNAPLTMHLKNTSLRDGVLAVLTVYKLGMEKQGDRLHVYRLKQ